MATRGHLKSAEFKQAGLAAISASAVPETPPAIPTTSPDAVIRSAATSRPVAPPTAKRPNASVSPIEAVAAKGAPAAPRFTAEETILLRGLASGASAKEMASQMRLPRESLYRLIGDLRRKTGASSDTALAVWVLRNMSSSAGERRGGGR